MQLEKSFIADIKNILAAARQKAYTAINHAMVQAYWHVGKRIVEEDQQGKEKATYGDALLKELSKSLTQELGQGFSYANLKNFRKFYITFPDFEKGYALRSLLEQGFPDANPRNFRQFILLFLVKTFATQCVAN